MILGYEIRLGVINFRTRMKQHTDIVPKRVPITIPFLVTFLVAFLLGYVNFDYDALKVK